MRQPGRSQPHLGDPKPIALLKQPVLRWDLQPIEFKFAVAADFLGAHDWNAPDNAPARLILVIEKRRKAAARIVRSPRHQDEMRGRRSPRDEPFSSVYDI